jgi:hypothetical protein
MKKGQKATGRKYLARACVPGKPALPPSCVTFVLEFAANFCLEERHWPAALVFHSAENLNSKQLTLNNGIIRVPS